MELNDYQSQLLAIWESDKSPDEELLFCCVGMAEESGEAMGKIKRWMRGEGFDREGYLKELGDVLAYLSIAAHSSGWQLSDLSLNGQQSTSSNLGNTISLFSTVNNLLDCIWADDFLKCPDWVKELLSDVYGAIVDCVEGHETKSTLSEVMQLNLDKLADRITRNGTTKGSGDNR